MGSEEAYNAIIRALKDRGVRIVNAVFEEMVFGNFMISLIDRGEEKSIVCDRGLIFSCKSINDLKGCQTVVPSLYDVTETELLHRLELR